MFATGLILLAAGTMHPHDVGTRVEPARPRANLAAYVSPSDYPAAALRNNEEGTTRFRLDIGANGRVTDCMVTASSGSPAIDNATCRIMRSRARFTPARDAAGNAVPDSVESQIGWSLPNREAGEPRYDAGRRIEPARARPRANLASYVSHGDYPRTALEQMQQGTVRFVLAVEPNGRVSDCRVTESSGSQALDDATCRIMRSRARFTPARDAAGNAVADTIESRIGWFLQ